MTAQEHERLYTIEDLREIETGLARAEIYGGRMDTTQMAQIGQD